MNRNSAPRTARGWARTLLRRLHREEDGQTLLLGVGLICVVLALLFVAASATAVYLDLKTLTSLADSAAAAGADSMEAHPYYGGDATDSAPGSLTDTGVRSKAAEDLSAQPTAARLEGVTIVSARAADSRTAVVTLQARSRPPFLPWAILPVEGFTITATGSARMTTTQ
ncbi:glycosyltransferase [Actinomyces oris]|uniref:Glycosyltransferase n=1 Tax=Actinomyces oris TaxID=544580 RepID=A0AAW8L8L1_9ACTO|nr:glycosyltransferase [Actinomyces oris]MDR0178342.1 glycosyltransferase [Actinomyces oris]